MNKAIQAPCNPKPTGKAKNQVRVGRMIIILINETIATKTVSPAPLRQPENITCEVWKWVVKAIIINIVEPSASTSGVSLYKETKKNLPNIKTAKSMVETIKAKR